MSLEQKYEQILSDLLKETQEKYERQSSIPFSQRLGDILGRHLQIIFYYSKGFEDFIKKQVELICSSQENIEILINWKTLLENLNNENIILTKETSELLISTIDIVIDEIKTYKRKINLKFEEYKTDVENNIQNLKQTRSMMLKSQQLEENQNILDQQHIRNNSMSIDQQMLQRNLYQAMNNQPNQQQFNQQQLANSPYQQNQQYSNGNQQQVANAYQAFPQNAQGNLNYQYQIIGQQINNSKYQDFNYQKNQNARQYKLQNNQGQRNVNQAYQNTQPIDLLLMNNQQNRQVDRINQMIPINNDISQSYQEPASEIFTNNQKFVISKVRKEGLDQANQKLLKSFDLGNKSMNQNGGGLIIENIDLILKDEDQISKLSQASDEIDQQMYQIYQQKTLKKQKKYEMITMLNYVLNIIYQSAVRKYSDRVILKANLFGSFLQGTCLDKDSDVDVIINFEGINIDYNQSLFFIKSVAYSKLTNEFEIQPIINSQIRIPFINIKNKITGLKIDIIYDNILGIMNSQLFYTYINIHIKIKVLCVLFKIWATKHQVKGKQQLTSYALLNMVIFYLICNNYIVSLQDFDFYNFQCEYKELTIYCQRQKQKLRICTSFEKNLNKIINKLYESNKLNNIEQIPLHQLFVGLIQFYLSYIGFNLNYNDKRVVITTRPQKLQGELKDFVNKKIISIQDPFEPTYNPGQRCSNEKFQPTISELQRVPQQIQNIQQVLELFN